MHRRTFLAGTAAAMAAPLQACTAARIPTIGFLAIATRPSHVLDLAGLRQGLTDVGLVEGKTVAIAERYADGKPQALPALRDELLALDVDLFVLPGHAVARAIAKTSRKPMVVAGLTYSTHLTDLFAAVNKPGGSVTGLLLGTGELSAKRIQILREAVPGLKTLAIVHNGTDPIWKGVGLEVEAAANAQELKTHRFELNAPAPADVDRIVAEAKAAGARGMIVVRDFMTYTLGEKIAAAAIGAGIATLSERQDFCAAGGFIAYGANIPDLFRRSAVYADKILRGAKPGDLPLQLPEKFDFIVNQKTAAAIALTVPPDLLVQATEVIE
jgi:putative tryptophan/tyrosine transport system substrate-binding protein